MFGASPGKITHSHASSTNAECTTFVSATLAGAARPNTPLKPTAAGFSRTSSRGRHQRGSITRPQLSGHPLGRKSPRFNT